MLAQNFKTPTDLGVTSVEFDALLKVLHGLETRQLQEIPVENAFTMPNIISMDCGAQGCILGWAYLISNRAAFDSPEMRATEAGDTKQCWDIFEKRPHLDELFFPDFYNNDIDCGSVTSDQAAIALRNFLTHGEPRWREALAG